ncbi:AAA domain-containing protein [Noviherbaspirillum malthae]|uniref:AAA domain-containing protein n=1 Tax=Noviherbaspirillum malthae TaxID=1260987 RepID=UPI00188E3048|nr:AAA domain-containing protein [Noviherbaspirillum malthae]
MNEAISRVLELLTYIEKAERLKIKPAFSVPTDYFVAHQHELKGLPEVQFHLQTDGDDVWLRVPRLLEIAAPDPGDKLRPWVNLPKSPDKQPELKSEVVTLHGKREVLRLRLADHPDIKVIFDWYVANQWEPWAMSEQPRRKTIAYYNHLFSLQQTIQSEGAETPIELVWGIGYAAWKKPGFATALKHPLLVQPCEIRLNEQNFDLEIRPRDVEPRLEADCYAEMDVAGIRQLEAFWRSSLATGAYRVNPFETSTFEGVLKAAVGHLDPSGAYEERTQDVTPPSPEEQLKVTNTWVIFGRKRSADIFLEDVRRLQENLKTIDSLPGVIRGFVEVGDSEVRVRPEQPFRGLSSSDSPAGAFELFFPLPYNDEQVSIIQKLESNDGVVVQGPPGTGKTHTIANVISHYLANGKRVLVTAKGESALAVLQEKLPERIRPLSVSLLSDERDGMKQFEHSIQTIASRVSSLNPIRAQSTIASLETELNQLHAKISHVDQTISAVAGKHMRNYSFQGRDVMPEELAKLILAQQEEHDWFDDEPSPAKDQKLPLDDADIHTLRQARIAVGENLTYLGMSLPSPASLPAWTELLNVHRDLVRARAIDEKVSQGNILALVDTRIETLEKARALVTFLEDRAELKQALASTNQRWISAFTRRLSQMLPDDPLLTALQQLMADVRVLDSTRKELLARAVEVPAGAESHEDFNDALTRLVAGKSAFSLPFGKGDARKLVAAVTTLGVPPAAKEDWECVRRLCAWRIDARKAIARWNALAGEFGLEPAADTTDGTFKIIVATQEHIETAHRLVFEFNGKLHGRLTEVFGKQTADRMNNGGEATLCIVLESLHAHADKERLAYAMKRHRELLQKLESHSADIVTNLRIFLSKTIGQASTDEAALEVTWAAMYEDLARVFKLQPALGDIKRVTAVIDAAGATNWANRLRTQPAGCDSDPVTPVRWMEAWQWRQAVMFLEQIDEHKKLRTLFEERRKLTAALARTYQDLIAEKTWLGVHNNSPVSVRQALQAYLNAVQAIGAGTGVKAVRFRKDAREAMQRAYQAVPCWVLPQWRVSETIPPIVGLFDLVVVDEASQSDIWALPSLLRGKKLLVVGDDKQVSPSAVGVANAHIMTLISRFLRHQPHGAQMTPDKSIYDLAKVVFAGNSVMLKEHFRCVPAIIEFSNREFYKGDIKPLRLPKANERLDPPLIDVFVKGGYRKGDVNPAEAEAILAEIEAILADKQLAGRSLGVVTLLGTAQAAHIQELVSRRIAPADVLERKIAVGPPPVFQGRERDIMMISMVLAPGDRAAPNRPDMNQRFNVALSRARDRMYLFRSVPESSFNDDTLNSRLIRHFRQPFHQDSVKVQVLREKCQSGFELEMFDELVKRGYRVQPQVPCGGYHIDFVVEGNEGRRLAIECDGDRFHGPGKWSDDMLRQRVLERAGWTFWRCFASSFVRRRNEVLEDLEQTLERLGIEPLGAESVDNTIWVHYKEVDPFGVDEGQDNEQITGIDEPNEESEVAE